MEKRNTKQKQGVIDVLKGHDAALSADDVLERLDTKANRVTVYRILDRFEQDGLVHRIVGLDGKSYYALCAELCDEEHHHDHHAHFQCKTCKTLTCVDVQVIRPQLTGVKVEHCQVLLTGVCAQCNHPHNGSVMR